MDELVTFDTRFGAITRREFAFKNPSSIGDITPPAEGAALALRTAARVSAGRWVAMCPCDGCSGAEYVSFDDPFIFCHECRNAQVAHLLIPVDLPDERTRGAVEAYLVARPIPVTRNWEPHEMVKFLRDENRAHGVRLSAS